MATTLDKCLNSAQVQEIVNHACGMIKEGTIPAAVELGGHIYRSTEICVKFVGRKNPVLVVCADNEGRLE